MSNTVPLFNDDNDSTYLEEYKKISDTYRSLAILALEQGNTAKAKQLLLKCEKQLEELSKKQYV